MENEPTKEQFDDEQLKAFEMEKIKRDCEGRTVGEEFNRADMTPTEHTLIGSTSDGRAYHPNHPVSLLAGRDLEKLNELRQAHETVFTVFVQGEPYWVPVRLLPLSNENIHSSDIQKTYEIIGPPQDLHKNEMRLEVDADELLTEKASAEQQKARDYLQEKYKAHPPAK